MLNRHSVVYRPVNGLSLVPFAANFTAFGNHVDMPRRFATAVAFNSFSSDSGAVLGAGGNAPVSERVATESMRTLPLGSGESIMDRPAASSAWAIAVAMAWREAEEDGVCGIGIFLW